MIFVFNAACVDTIHTYRIANIVTYFTSEKMHIYADGKFVLMNHHVRLTMARQGMAKSMHFGGFA